MAAIPQVRYGRLVAAALLFVIGIPLSARAQSGTSKEAPAASAGRTSAAKPASRPDPFAPTWSVQPPPAPVLSQITPIRIAARISAVYDPPLIEVQETSDRRLAGVLIGSGIYALLDGPEGGVIVQPGDLVGDYRVQEIRSDSLVLRRAGYPRVHMQVVPLTDARSTNRH